MELKKKKHPHIYIPWFTSDEEFYDSEEGQEDSWVDYLRRNLQHPVGEESPFPYSSWSYTRHDSPFEKEEDESSVKKSDSEIHDEVLKLLYENPDVDASNIKTIVLNGIVCLFGTVKTLLEKNEASRIISKMPEVWNVRNELKIEESKRRSLSDIPVP